MPSYIFIVELNAKGPLRPTHIYICTCIYVTHEAICVRFRKNCEKQREKIDKSRVNAAQITVITEDRGGSRTFCKKGDGGSSHASVIFN